VLHISAILCNLDATQHILKKTSCSIDKALETAELMTQEILKEGGIEMLDDIRRGKCQ
jgi:hypothetical protein